MLAKPKVDCLTVSNCKLLSLALIILLRGCFGESFFVENRTRKESKEHLGKKSENLLGTRKMEDNTECLKKIYNFM